MPRRKVGAPPPEPLLRMAMKESDFKEMLDKLEDAGWDHPAYFRLRAKWAEHTRATGAVTKRKRVAG